jgi:hypothetical protein
METYEGDGINICETIVPEIVAISPTEGSMDEATLVQISFLYPVTVSEYHRHSPTCRFGSLTIHGENVTNSSMLCRVPPRAPGTVDVQISLNGADWSRGRVVFVFRQRFHLLLIMQFVFIYAVLVFAVATGIWKLVSLARPEPQEETRAFITGRKKSKGVGFGRKKGIKERFGP